MAWPKPSLTADVVALLPRGPEAVPAVLLIERAHAPCAGEWALPGGFVDVKNEGDQGEAPAVAAARELLEETGVTFAPEMLLPVGTFAAPGRDPRGRVVSMAYLGMLPPGTTARAGDDAAAARFFPLDALPAALAFDHAEVLGAAWTALWQRARYEPVLAALGPLSAPRLDQLCAVLPSAAAPTAPADRALVLAVHAR